MEISKLKLIIWDLDDTFWKGTLSEGGITPIQENINLVKQLTDRGVINTICSKNDIEPVREALSSLGILDYFVFLSIDWTPKGQRISHLIKEMGLQPKHCLFIDDNNVNLNEAKFYSPDLSVAGPECILDLQAFVSSTQPTDLVHKRLNQYHVLEQKQKAKNEASSNEAFLYESNTQVEILHNCLDEIDRIHELLQRTNQLNYTKLRSTKEELISLLHDTEIDAGYVKVSDKFGDYGIVGFYAQKAGKLIHFLFSCRTIGQGVEQYVYAIIGHPELNVVGDVVNNVTNADAPKWINQTNKSQVNDGQKITNLKVIFKGGCDLMNMSAYLNTDNVIEEFTYIGEARKNQIEHHYHSKNLLLYPFLSKEEQQQMVEDYIFNDKDVFKTHIYDDDIAIVFMGVMIQPNLGVYRHKKSGKIFAFCEYGHPLTDPQQWDNYINNTIYTADNKFTREWLQWFSVEHEFLGPLTAEQTLADYKEIVNRMNPNTRMCFLLGSEIPFEKETNPNYFGREKEYVRLNNLIKEWAKEDSRILYIEFSKYIRGQEDFTNNINHFQRRVYFEAATEANLIISKLIGEKLEQKSKWYLRLKIWADNLGSTGFYQTRLWHVLRIPYVWLRNKLQS